MTTEIYLIIGLLGGFGGLGLGVIFAEKSDNFNYFLVSVGIGIIILIISMIAQQLDYNMQKEIYDKTVFQPWVKSLDSKSCEELGDQILKQKLLENKTAITAVMPIFDSKGCQFTISDQKVMEILN